MTIDGRKEVTAKNLEGPNTCRPWSEVAGQRIQTQGLAALIFVLLFFNTVCLFLYHGQLSKLDGGSNIVRGNRYELNPSVVSDKKDEISSESTSTKNVVLEYFKEARVILRDGDLQNLPTWSQIESIIGKRPVILGLDRCEIYRSKVPPLRRMLGASGMFNSGTNLVTRLLKENCVIPERFDYYGPGSSKEKYGIRWQVPWGKHTAAKLKYNYSAPLSENITKDDALPIVTVRNPYDWMRSMCQHSYTAEWSKNEKGPRKKQICPHLVYTNSTSEEKWPVEVTVKLANQYLTFTSLAHLWNEWYAQYEQDADYPVSFDFISLTDIACRNFLRVHFLAMMKVHHCTV
eukprot:CCRYP_007099-RB/>CCRYP_007099-RB protein AED:0.31 eAED:0.31 QI:230/1/1/1/1/1/2/791/345